VVEFVEVPYKILLSERIVRLGVIGVARLEFLVETLPLLVVVLAIILVLLDCVDLLLCSVHAESLFEGERIYLLENSLESN